MKGAPDVIVARSGDGNAALQRMLSGRGIEAVGIETIRLDDPESWADVDSAIGRISQFDWVAFTSPRGVEAFASRLEGMGLKGKGLGPKFAAVGSKTASALGRIGIVAEFIPDEFLTSALAEGLPGKSGTRVLLLRADLGDKKLAESLKKRGFEVEDVVAYHTRFVTGPVDGGVVKRAKVVAFASPSEVEGFRRRLGKSEFKALASQAKAACIGPVTARAAEDSGFMTVEFSKEHTLESLAEMIGEMTADA
ncbi:MAG: uroporphyrinogen-III synthase [Nitrososphaerota archaeon]|nr:uroporphyrinogen-III synthase [Nitrososphaerota archaeon]